MYEVPKVVLMRRFVYLIPFANGSRFNVQIDFTGGCGRSKTFEPADPANQSSEPRAYRKEERMNIVVAHDGSKHGKWAMEWLGRLPLTTEPAVTVLHVVDVASLRAPFMAQPVVWANEAIVQQELKQLDVRAKKTMAEAKQFMMATKLKGRVVRTQGPIGTTILDKAPKRDGLLMLGSRGLDALDRFMLGSVSTQVTLHAPCSVLVVKEQPHPLKRIIFATDGSKTAEKALQFLLTKLAPDLPNPPGRNPIEIVVIHSVPFLNYPELKEAGNRLVGQNAEKLIKAGYVVEGVVRLGKPADEVLKVASKKNADLIVTGAKGQGAIARFLLGSVSTRIVQHSTCSVLVVR
ncbi:MAG TPA: universal stress protein [Nitrospiraceae bacterium]|nr:universal stress protein [Nitrospiraceae bacterium]